MISFKKRFCNISLSLMLVCQCSCAVFAQYEVMRAKTILTDDQKKELKNQNIYSETRTYNDTELPNFSSDSGVASALEKKIKNFVTKRKAKNVNSSKDELENEDIKETNQSDNADSSKPSLYQESQEVVSDKNKFQINADKITYDEEDGNVYAKGNVEIISAAQEVKLRADDAVLEKPSQTIKLHGNVKVIKNGAEMSGESLLVDLNEQNILMDNPVMNAYSFTITAQEGYLISNDFQAINGTIKSNKRQEYILETAGFEKYNNIDRSSIRDFQTSMNIDRGKDTKKTSLQD